MFVILFAKTLCAKNQIDTPAVYNYNDVINQIDT